MLCATCSCLLMCEAVCVYLRGLHPVTALESGDGGRIINKAKALQLSAVVWAHLGIPKRPSSPKSQKNLIFMDRQKKELPNSGQL